MIGETTMNIRVFSIPGKTIALAPPATNPAPIRPPIKAWLLEDGRPKYHVIKFQVIAPTNAATITYTVENSGCIIPLPTVAATAVPNMNGPIKFAIASHTNGV